MDCRAVARHDSGNWTIRPLPLSSSAEISVQLCQCIVPCIGACTTSTATACCKFLPVHQPHYSSLGREELRARRRECRRDKNKSVPVFALLAGPFISVYLFHSLGIPGLLEHDGHCGWGWCAPTTFGWVFLGMFWLGLAWLLAAGIAAVTRRRDQPAPPDHPGPAA